MLAPLYRPDPKTPALTLTRDFRQPVAKVWAALTTPARFVAWMGVEWLGDAQPKLGADFSYRFADTDLVARGHVLAFEPPHLLEHSWFEDVEGGAAVIRWSLKESADGGCRLTLTHLYRTPDDSARTGAGWSMLLDKLARSLGEPSDPDLVGGWPAARARLRATLPYAALRDAVLSLDGAGGSTLTFVRRIARPLPQVWGAISTPEGLSRWMVADAQVEPRVGGRFVLAFRGMEAVMNGRITAFDPPRRLGFTWPEAHAGADAQVSIVLEADGEGATRLTLEHRFSGDRDLPDFAMGWHWHLDQLEAAVDGRTAERQPQRERTLRQIYEKTLRA